MYTPSISLHRKNLRSVICDSFPGENPETIFKKIAPAKTKIITIDDLEPYCEIGKIPAASLEMIFAPYGVKDIQIAQSQFIQFINDDFPNYDTEPHLNPEITQKQKFILSKFIGVLRTKYGATLSQRWNSALTRNPPNTLNTTLRLSALCHLYQNMNLPFSMSEFVDSLFAFYGQKIESIDFAQFGSMFSAIP